MTKIFCMQIANTFICLHGFIFCISAHPATMEDSTFPCNGFGSLGTNSVILNHALSPLSLSLSLKTWDDFIHMQTKYYISDSITLQFYFRIHFRIYIRSTPFLLSWISQKQSRIFRVGHMLSLICSLSSRVFCTHWHKSTRFIRRVWAHHWINLTVGNFFPLPSTHPGSDSCVLKIQTSKSLILPNNKLRVVLNILSTGCIA